MASAPAIWDTAKKRNPFPENRFPKEPKNLYNKINSFKQLDSPCTSYRSSSCKLLFSTEMQSHEHSEFVQVALIRKHEGHGSDTINSLRKVDHIGHDISKNSSPQTSKGKKSPKYVSLMDRVLKGRMHESVDRKMNNCSYMESSRACDCLPLGTESVSEGCVDATDLQARCFLNVCVQPAETVNGLSYGNNYESLFTGNIPVFAVVLDKPLSTLSKLTKAKSSQQFHRRKSSSSSTYEVDLTLQTCYGGSRVPLVSLISKVNGKPILGYPIQVEAIESLHMKTFNVVHKPPRFSDHLTARSSSMKKKQPGAKKQGISPRKIRSLSSLIVRRRDKKEGRKPLVKQLASSIIAHVPIKLVFQRLKDALGCRIR